MATWLEEERAALEAKRAEERALPKVVFISSMHPGRRDGRPYHLDTIDIDGRCPRQRWYETYADLVCAIERANPGKSIREG
jgi:hypothetical protein